MVNDGLAEQYINGLDFPAQCVVCDAKIVERADFLCAECRELRFKLTRNARPKIGVMPHPVEFARR